MSAYKPEDLEEQGKEEVGQRCSGLRRDLLECLKQSECVSKVSSSLTQLRLVGSDNVCKAMVLCNSISCRGDLPKEDTSLMRTPVGSQVN